MRPLLLASASPRRAELLERIGFRLDVLPAAIDETPLAESAPDHVARLALGKLRTVVAIAPERARAAIAVLAADTIVTVEGRILGKPADRAAAAAMLDLLAGRTHAVLTAYRLLDGASGRERGRTVESLVTFRALPKGEAEAYLATCEWRGKAGGYAVQGIAAAFVQAIAGSYTNVVGLPLAELCDDLLALGVLTALPYPDGRPA